MCSPLDFNDPYDSRIRLSGGDKQEFFNFFIMYLENRNNPYESDAVYVASAKLGFPLHDVDPNQKEFDFPNITDLFYELLPQIRDLDNFLSFAKEQGLNETTLLFLEFILTSGITSFSSQHEDPHMWAYYANNHKGFCVKYKIKNTNNYKLSKVTYTKDPLEYLCKGNISYKDLEPYILSKSNHWSSEHESRLFSFSGRNNLIASPFEIESICTGLKMSKDDIRTLRSITDDSVPIHYSLLDEKKFRIRWIQEETCFL